MLNKLAASIFIAGAVAVLMGFGLYEILKTDQDLALGCIFIAVAVYGALLHSKLELKE